VLVDLIEPGRNGLLFEPGAAHELARRLACLTLDQPGDVVMGREPILDAEVTEEAVAQYFAHRIQGKVTRWRLPGINGFNFLLRQALGGGGMASLKADPLAKAFAQMLLDMPVRVPASLAQKLAA